MAHPAPEAPPPLAPLHPGRHRRPACARGAQAGAVPEGPEDLRGQKEQLGGGGGQEGVQGAYSLEKNVA